MNDAKCDLCQSCAKAEGLYDRCPWAVDRIAFPHWLIARVVSCSEHEEKKQ